MAQGPAPGPQILRPRRFNPRATANPGALRHRVSMSPGREARSQPTNSSATASPPAGPYSREASTIEPPPPGRHLLAGMLCRARPACIASPPILQLARPPGVSPNHSLPQSAPARRPGSQPSHRNAPPHSALPGEALPADASHDTPTLAAPPDPTALARPPAPATPLATPPAASPLPGPPAPRQRAAIGDDGTS